MITLTPTKRSLFAPSMVLRAKTAADLMTTNPVSIRQDATVPEAATFFAYRGISAAPVINEAGRPIGVLSCSDILSREAQGAVSLVGSREYHQQPQWPVFSADVSRIKENAATVRDIMTPVVFCVGPNTPVTKVVEKLLALKVGRLFVADDNGILIGVISAIDVLAKLRGGEPQAGESLSTGEVFRNLIAVASGTTEYDGTRDLCGCGTPSDGCRTQP